MSVLYYIRSFNEDNEEYNESTRSPNKVDTHLRREVLNVLYPSHRHTIYVEREGEATSAYVNQD